jgi:thiol-disulfide isomerase/thioredoxin
MRAALFALALMLSPCAFALEAGGAVPDLVVPKLDEPTQTLAFASLRGSVVYVDFWASWCVPCRVSMPALDAIYKRDRAKGFAVVGDNMVVSGVPAKRFLAKVSVTFPLVSDGQDAVAKVFDVKTMPSGYLIDRKGVVRKVHRGFTEETAAALEREIEALLKEP